MALGAAFYWERMLPLSLVSQRNHTWVAQVLSQHRRHGAGVRTLILIVVAHLTDCIFFGCAGWVAVTAHAEEKLLLRAYTPKGTALMVREPPLLPYVSTIRGARIAGTAAYRTKKPPSLVENLKTTGRK